jgi:hypothetical protein
MKEQGKMNRAGLNSITITLSRRARAQIYKILLSAPHTEAFSQFS